jgi:hypothetical protein
MKIIAKCDESQRAPRGFGASFPIPNLSTSTIKNSEYFDLPRELENETLEKKGENKSAGRGRGDGGSLNLFNRAITQSQFYP